ncbi:MAG: hypothetical protein K2M80_07285 [Muribaculaceae bacterium]|nr:hypothetical protein [Muribaculaceae bacterium]
MNRIINLSLTLIVIFTALTSCLKNEEGDNTFSVAYATNFTRVKTLGSDNAYINQGTVYKLTRDYATNRYSLIVGNFKPNAETKPFNFEVKDLPYQNVNGKLVITGNNLTATVKENGVEVGHTLNSLRVMISEYMLPGFNRRGESYNFTFTYDNTYTATTVQNEVAVAGSTVITDLTNGEFTEQKNAVYSYVLYSETGKARIYINNLRFNNYNYSQIVLKDIPFTVDDNGVSLQMAEEFTPEFESTAAPKFTISNFRMDTNNECSTLVNFTLNSTHSLSATLGL